MQETLGRKCGWHQDRDTIHPAICQPEIWIRMYCWYGDWDRHHLSPPLSFPWQSCQLPFVLVLTCSLLLFCPCSYFRINNKHEINGWKALNKSGYRWICCYWIVLCCRYFFQVWIFFVADLPRRVDHRLLRADPGEHQDGAAQRELLAGRLPARHHRPPHSSHSQWLSTSGNVLMFPLHVLGVAAADIDQDWWNWTVLFCCLNCVFCNFHVNYPQTISRCESLSLSVQYLC